MGTGIWDFLEFLSIINDINEEFVLNGMEKKYISFDIEAAGPTPGKYSMLSLGACVVGDTATRFYREIKPISREFVLEAMRVSARGLRCLDGFRCREEYHFGSDKFNPGKVLDVLEEIGSEPRVVMKEYAEWVRDVTKGFRPIEAAAPIKFDGAFTSWYFDNFYDLENPFGHSGEDINSLYRGVTGDVNSHIVQLGFRPNGLPHNALEDAIIQAKEMEAVLELMGV
jgi:ribonuclease T